MVTPDGGERERAGVFGVLYLAGEQTVETIHVRFSQAPRRAMAGELRIVAVPVRGGGRCLPAGTAMHSNNNVDADIPSNTTSCRTDHRLSDGQPGPHPARLYRP